MHATPATVEISPANSLFSDLVELSFINHLCILRRVCSPERRNIEGGETILKIAHLGEIMLVTLLLASSLLVGLTSSVGVYDPWCDFDDDGDIDIFDIVRIADAYGTSGDNITKAGLEYDSDWINITDKRGQHFNITHNQNSTDIMIEITGKEASDDGPHQNHYGLTTYTKTLFEWNQTYGGTNGDDGYSMVQTADGGYAIAGYTLSFGAGSYDFWLVKTDAAGNHQWNQTYGGASLDYGRSVVQTADGGYAIAGYTLSFGAGSYDFWLVKTDAAGNHQWNQTYGGTGSDRGYSVVQTADGGYTIVGSTDSFGAGGSDVWLLKTDIAGNHLWNQTYGGTNTDTGASMVQTADGGYTIAGSTNSFGAGSYDVWLVKTDAAGNHLWNQTYGGASSDGGYSVVQTADGGYAIVGYTLSFGAGSYDFWLVKTDAAGNHLWNQTYGGANTDRGYSVVQTADGGYTIVGYTDSFGVGNYDFWLVKAYEPRATIEVEYGLAWTASAENTITLYRGEDDPYWNYVRVRVWKIKETS